MLQEIKQPSSTSLSGPDDCRLSERKVKGFAALSSNANSTHEPYEKTRLRSKNAFYSRKPQGVGRPPSERSPGYCYTHHLDGCTARSALRDARGTGHGYS